MTQVIDGLNMNEELAQRCLEELVKKQDFNRLSFLKIMAQLCVQDQHRQTMLTFYALYHFTHRRDQAAAHQSIEQALDIRSDNISAAMAMGVKAVALSHVDQQKHTQAVRSFKEAVDIVKAVGNSRTPLSEIQKRCFPGFMARIIELLKLTRGRREFLVTMDEVRSMIHGKPQMVVIEQAILGRMEELRAKMGCHGKSEQEKRILYTSNSTGMLNSFTSDKSETSSSASIYISRLYEQRRKNLGKRDGSGIKKQHSGLKREASSSRGKDPYQIKYDKSSGFKRESPDCFIM